MSVKAVHIIPHDGIGGVEAAARTMAAASAPKDYCLLYLAGGSIDPAVPALSSPTRSALDPRSWLRAVRTLRRLQPPLVIASLWKSVPILILARLSGLKSKIAYTINNERPHHLVDRILSGLAIRLADEVWADSSQTMALRRLPPRKARAISFFLPIEEGGLSERILGPTFVVWARITAQKGLDRALPIIAKLRQMRVQATLRIYGPDGGSLDALRRQAEHLDLQDAVSFHSPVERKALGLISNDATFFLMPSRKEGMGIACAEAMQLGLIPVVTAVGEMANYVVDGQNGLLIDPGRPDETARRLADLLADPVRLEAMREAARLQWQGKVDHVTSMRAAIDSLIGNPS